MDLSAWTQAFDTAVEQGMTWLTDHGGGFFDFIRFLLEGSFDALCQAFLLLPFWGVALLFAGAAWRLTGRKSAIFTLIAISLCHFIGLWEPTVETLCLVIISVLLALIVGLPIGVVAGYFPRVYRLTGPVLDLIQTLPPYLYLLPAIAFLGYGPATAILATFIVALPPIVRLSALGFQQTPANFIEFGLSSGASAIDMFRKIRLPFAVPGVMAGINQSLMMAFGMVVIAGIVGSGGLGQTIYGAIRKLDIALSVNAALAIVVLTIVLDRLTQALSRKNHQQKRGEA